MTAGRALIVSNRLPVALERRDGHWQGQPTVGGLASALASAGAPGDRVWLGWPGVSAADAGQHAEIEAELAAQGYTPVFIPPGVFDRYYHGFSNATIWPLFHYFTRLARYDRQEWEAYREANRLFADRVAAVARPSDTIWVHDYHLLLLPSLLRQRLPNAAIGFFLHIPFPSWELLRELPWREPLLRGLLGADLVGFHTYDYTRHFLRSLLRGLGLENEFGEVAVEHRLVRADTFPLGVDAGGLERTAEQVRTTRPPPPRVPADCRTILSVDRLDFTKGLPERLAAFDSFLERYRDWRGKVRLTLICVPSRVKVPAYQQLKRQVDELVGNINGKYSTPAWSPIQYLYRAFSTEELIAFYLDADVALVTPLRDGMNLVAKEYLACRADQTGVLVLGEAAGAAAELGEALIVNPNDVEGTAAALLTALTMPLAEQVRRNAPMRARLQRYTVGRWVEDFLTRLSEVKAAQRGQSQPVSGADREALLRAYAAANRRLLLLDYDGTLVPLAPLPGQAAPDQEVRDLLGALTSVPGNIVVVISGRDYLTLERWLGGVGAILVAEHGAWVCRDPADGWQLRAGSGATDWKAQVRPLLETYVDRTPGAVLEEKALALAWHYRMADPELGTQRAKELADMLGSLVANTDLMVLRGSKVLEVKQSSVGKGKAALNWLTADPAPEFVLAMGDDETDELMFEVLPPTAWAVRVGQSRHTRAPLYVDDAPAARQLLRALLAAVPTPDGPPARAPGAPQP